MRHWLKRWAGLTPSTISCARDRETMQEPNATRSGHSGSPMNRGSWSKRSSGCGILFTTVGGRPSLHASNATLKVRRSTSGFGARYLTGPIKAEDDPAVLTSRTPPVSKVAILSLRLMTSQPCSGPSAVGRSREYRSSNPDTKLDRRWYSIEHGPALNVHRTPRKDARIPSCDCAVKRSPRRVRQT